MDTSGVGQSLPLKENPEKYQDVGKLYPEISRYEAKNWNEIVCIYNEKFRNVNEDWLFRGQDCDSFPSSNLHRELSRLGVSFEEADKYEYSIVKMFERNGFKYKDILSDNLSFSEIISAMQHYSAPTRFIDVTYSFYISLFFALEKHKPIEFNKSYIKYSLNCPYFKFEVPSIFAIESNWLTNAACRILKSYNCSEYSDFYPGKNEKQFEKFFLKQDSRKQFVYNLTPKIINPRLSIQQGTFLCQGDITKSFWSNFNLLLKYNKRNSIAYIELNIIDEEAYQEIMRELYRMNITRATLFPGLQGFAESVKSACYFPNVVENICKNGIWK
ncbi:MAG: FRG domain-containing protein [Thermodesulfobacteriota bacterium]